MPDGTYGSFFGTNSDILPPNTQIVYSTGGGGYGVELLTTYIQSQGGGGSNLNPISNTLTVSGAIAPTDTLTLITGGTAFTLAAAADTHTHNIINLSGGNITVTLELNSSSQGIVIANGSNLRVAYQPSLATPTYLNV